MRAQHPHTGVSPCVCIPFFWSDARAVVSSPIFKHPHNIADMPISVFRWLVKTPVCFMAAQPIIAAYGPGSHMVETFSMLVASVV